GAIRVQVDRDHLRVVQQAEVGPAQQAVQYIEVIRIVVETVVQVSAQYGTVIEHIVQDAHVVLVEHVIEAHNLQVGTVHSVQVGVQVAQHAHVLNRCGDYRGQDGAAVRAV